MSKQKLELTWIDKKVRLLLESHSLSISLSKVPTCGREFI
jgi:hypothetical protein